MKPRAVIFALGGVLIGSPLHAIADYERELGFARNAVNRVVVTTGPGGAWSRLERGELDLEGFYPSFEADCAGAGLAIDAREMMRRVAEIAVPRPAMLGGVGRLAPRGPRAGHPRPRDDAARGRDRRAASRDAGGDPAPPRRVLQGRGADQQLDHGGRRD